MSDSAAKNERIRETYRITCARHASMDCRVYEIKVVTSKLNRAQKESVNGIFREAKWCRNAILAGNEPSNRKVLVKAGDHMEERELVHIGSQILQSVQASVRSEIKGLSTKKQKSEKVGALKFKSVCNAVTLKQYKTTYSIDFEHNRISVQKVKKPFYVRGLKQIPSDAEIANARLIRKPNGLYFHITCFVPHVIRPHTGHMEGIDFGIGHNLTLTDGTTIDIRVSESKSTKLLSKRMNRAFVKNGRKQSNNHYKRIGALRRSYQRDANRRKDLANKAIHDILARNDFIAIQDEMIHNWHSGLFGKQVQHSAMGLIKAKLKNNFKVHVVDRRFPSTQVCPECGCLTKHPLIKREYDCAHCGYHHPSRDQKSAQSILDEALKQVSVERRAQSPVEVNTAVSVIPITDVSVSPTKQEARSF